MNTKIITHKRRLTKLGSVSNFLTYKLGRLAFLTFVNANIKMYL